MKNDKQPTPPPAEEVEILVNPAENVLGGGIRGEVYGCPTGLSKPTAVPRQESDTEKKADAGPGKEPRDG